MFFDLLSILLGFVEGFSLILSPCILPILPIIFAGSLAGKQNRAFGVIAGFVVMFALLAFFSRWLIRYVGADLNEVRYIAYGLLFALGLVMLFTRLSQQFSKFTHRFTALGAKWMAMKGGLSEFWSGCVVGALVSIVWVPCAGPILAAVIVQIAVEKASVLSFLILLAFGIGVSLPMLTIVFCGKEAVNKWRVFKTKPALLRQLLAVMILLSVTWMVYQETQSTVPVAETTIKTQTQLQKGLWRPYSPPEIRGVTEWINSAPLSLLTLKGHVVLVDFWTYSCINCLRTLPYLKAFYQRYHDKGLVIIGVHSPEFEFEKDRSRVKQAVARLGIPYPVAMDNQFVSWRQFNNHYWPAVYLINKQGKVVYEHFGEGDEAVLENNIRFLLQVLDVQGPLASHEDDSTVRDITPETYLGYARAASPWRPFFLVQDLASNYAFPKELPLNAWALQGLWKVEPHQVSTKTAHAHVAIHFKARDVFVVMGSRTEKPIPVRVTFKGLRDNGNNKQRLISVNRFANYHVMRLQTFGEGVLTLSPEREGLEVYTITFGQ